MANFSPYTVPQEGPTYQPPIPLELILKGAVYKQNQAEEGLKQTNAELDYLMNLPTLPGADTEIKNQKIRSLTDSMKGLAIQQLGTPGTQAQIRANIAKLTQDSDFQNVVTRGTLARNEQKKMDEFAEKGKTYISPQYEALMDYANNYSSKGKYLKNIELGNKGFIAPNTGELMKQAKEITRLQKKNVTDKYGNTHTEEYYDPNDLNASLDVIISQNPNYYQYQDYQFKKATRGVNWQDEAFRKFIPHIETEAKIKADALSNFNITKDPKYRQMAAEADANIKYYNDLLYNPHTENELKDELFKSQVKEERAKMVGAMNAVQESENKLEERTKIALDTQKDVYINAIKSVTPGLIAMGYSPSEIGSGNVKLTQQDWRQAQTLTTQIEADKTAAKSAAKAGADLSNLLVDVKDGKISNEWLESTLNDIPITTMGSDGVLHTTTSKEQLDPSFTPYVDDSGNVHYKVISTKLVPKEEKHWYNYVPIFGPDVEPEHIENPSEERTKSIYEILDKNYKTGRLPFAVDDLKQKIESTAGVNFKDKLNTLYNQSSLAPKSSYSSTDTFSVGGYDYTYKEVEDAAKAENKTVEEYIKLKGLTKK